MKEEKIIVNKLILIGNGFDLSLGLKTSYKDFLLWFLKTETIKAISNAGRQNAPFPKYLGRYDSFQKENRPLVVFGFSENELFDVLVMRDYRINADKLSEITKIKDFLDFISIHSIEIKENTPGGIFKRILNDSISNWVDIEGAYFELLKKIIKSKNKEEIEKLNSDFNFIISKLEEYLSEIKYDKEGLKTKTKGLLRRFIRDIDFNDLINVNDEEIVETKVNYFLNFNYTRTVEDMTENFLSLIKDKKQLYDVNHIHGELKNTINPMIFGFGDEMNDEYPTIEKLNDNRFLHFIKSFRYSKSSNYRNLLRFLNSNSYQVIVYGHSCGLSDRIMLNHIFEHENCKSIKIYFYKDSEGNDDFMSKNMEISRHFKSNKLMRQKIVEKSDSDFVHQIKLK